MSQVQRYEFVCADERRMTMLDKAFLDQLEKDVAILCKFYKELNQEVAMRQAHARLKKMKSGRPVESKKVTPTSRK